MRLNPSDTSQINRRLRISGSNIAVIRVASIMFYFEELDKISNTQKTYVSSVFAVPVFFWNTDDLLSLHRSEGYGWLRGST